MANPKIGEREVIQAMLERDRHLIRHGGRTVAGVYARVGAKLLSISAAIWHNWLTDAPRKRSLTAYDH